MKKYVILIFALFTVLTGFAQSYRGIYVDNFDKILGNRLKEDSLLNYCKSNGFNALCTYKTKDLERKFSITKPQKGGKILASFIKRAKQNYGIVSFAMSSEQFSTFNEIVKVYNLSRIDTLERVNVFNFEFEYWHKRSTAPEGYYCKKYLQPSGCSCDSSGAFKFYRKQIKSIDSLAATMFCKSEVYVGKPTPGQALVIANTVDRILVDVYLKDPEKAYERASDRFDYFAAASKKVTLIPIWGSTHEFLGEWLKSNSIEEADKIFMKDFNAHKTTAQKNCQVPGFQWYKYGTMKR